MNDVNTVNQVKNNNIKAIKNALRSIPEGTKNTVAQMTGLSVATCNTILNELAQSGEILETGSTAPTIGRPPKSYRFNESYSYVLAVFTYEENGYTLNSAVMDLLGNIVYEDTLPMNSIEPEDIIEYIGEKITEEPKIQYISLGISGFYYNGIVSESGIESLVGVDLKGMIEKAFHLPVFIENDTNAMAHGVYAYGELTESKNDMALLAFFKERQPGCGIIIGGKVHAGNTMFAGEVSNLVFGFDNSRNQRKNLLPAEYTIECAVTCVISLCCTVNPELIVFTGEALDRKALDKIRRQVKKHIPEEHMPILRYGNDVRKYYFWGLCANALADEI